MGWFKLNLNNQFINDKFSKFVKSINENDLYYFVHSFFVDQLKRVILWQLIILEGTKSGYSIKR